MKVTSGTIWKQLVKYALPVLMGSILQQFYNTADSIIVGKYIGKEALSAVGGSASVVFSILIGFFTGVSTGGTVIVGRFYGADQKNDMVEAIYTCLGMSAVSGAVLGVMGYFATPWMMEVMHTPEDVMAEAVDYMSVYFCGTAASLLYNMCVGIMRALGDSKTPMLIGIAGSSVNIGLNLLFIIVFHKGVTAVALATVISQLISVVLAVTALKKSVCSLHIGNIRIKQEYLLHILRIGLPMGIQSVMYGLSNGVVQAHINMFGTDVVAAWTAYTKIVGYYWTIMASFGVTITTFVSQNHGAGKLDRIKSGILQMMGISAGITVAISFIFYTMSGELMGIFIKDPAVLQIGIQQLQFMSPFLIIYIGVEVFGGALRGMGYSFGPTLISLITVCGLSIVWVEGAAKLCHSMTAILTGFPATWFVNTAALVGYSFWKMRGKRQ